MVSILATELNILLEHLGGSSCCRAGKILSVPQAEGISIHLASVARH